MSKDDAARTRGEVLEVLPGATFRVRLGNGHVIVAHVAGAMRMHMARILPGDEVAVELAPYDPTRGRIVSRTR